MFDRRYATILAACALLASLAAAPARAQGAADPLIRENATVKLADHTWYISDENTGLVPNVGIVGGDRATLVIDPGLGRSNGEAVLREARKLSDNTEFYVVSTHFHPEHTTGHLAFPPEARYINSTVQQREFEESGAQMIRTFAGRSPLTGRLLSDARVFDADITFDREYSLDLGGVTVRFVVVGPTHTRGDTGFFVEGDGVLFSGDVVMNESFLAANQASSMDAWLAAFDTFEAMRPTTIVPAHGPVGPGSIISTNRAIMERVRDRARELKAQGRSADETAATVRVELEAAYPGWPRANGLTAAARSAWTEAR